MPMLYLLDENISPEVAVLSQRFRVDAVHIQDVLAKGVDDAVILAYAAAENRRVVTANGADFRQLSLAYERVGRTHSGIVVLRRPPPRSWSREVSAALLRLAREYPQGLYPLQIIDLPPKAIRPRQS